MFQNKNEYKILRLFFDNPNREFYLREIARLFSISPSVIFRILNKLEEEGLLKKDKKKAITNFKLNSSEKVKRLKRITNISLVYESGLVDFLINKYNHPESIILFGSYLRGENDEKGDADIAVITKKHISLDMSKYEKYINRKIHLLEVDLNKVSKEFKNNLANGFILEGYLTIE